MTSAVIQGVFPTFKIPNPYLFESAYDRSPSESQVRFSNLPLEHTTIRVFSLSGTLVRSLVKPSGLSQLFWDLETNSGQLLASGMYIVHFEVEDVGTKVVKFGVVRGRR